MSVRRPWNESSDLTLAENPTAPVDGGDGSDTPERNLG